MNHKREDHPSTIQNCRYFMQGNCGFGKDCWYNHNQYESCKPTSQQILKEFKCHLCSNIFKSKQEIMKHRKTGHIEKISDCVNNKNGWCRFSAKEYLYKHSKSSYEDESESQNPRMSRLF